MGAMPQKMVFGVAVGFIGGILALAAMAYAWNGTVDSMTLIGLDMLVAVLFFAVAGCFTKYSPVPGSTIAVLSAICVAFTLIAMFYEAMFMWLGVILVVLGIVNVIFAVSPSVTKWVDSNRVI